ncbi:sulfatase family protein [Halosimplex salinum]|uniref:sulfatase family protein n=1 Tax=Halosimplex salinum TaxID=1710538 RepID=UPI000F4A0993|nr:sulfatase-like hydrolase/transferase [Halosimplex salinum]
MSNPNLLFVCVDCLRDDFVDTEHADTPFLDGLVERGTHYSQMYSTATTTTPCVTSFMTGTYSERNGVYSLEEAKLDEGVPTLAEHLSAAGYDTRALVTGPIVADTGLDRGFDEYHYRDRRAELVGDWFDDAVAELEDVSEPFFCYLHLWEIHTPVDVPDGYDDPEYGRYPYARTLSALDRSLEAFCDRLPENTVVAVHGDHGEAIAYRDSYLHKVLKFLRTGVRYGLGVDTRSTERKLKRRFDRDPPIHDHFMEDAHGENVFDFTTNVPFVLAGPGVESDSVDAQVRQVDIMPTLLDAVGVDREETTQSAASEAAADGGDESPARLDGRSLLPPGEVDDRDAYVRACGKALIREENWQRGVRSGGWKYVEYPNRDWEPELYDLEADPDELNPVEDDRVASRLRARIPEEGVRETEKLEIDGLLEDLGYK